jgi:hypothetical protein
LGKSRRVTSEHYKASVVKAIGAGQGIERGARAISMRNLYSVEAIGYRNSPAIANKANAAQVRGYQGETP